MDSGRSLAGEQEFREPKRKKRIPGVIPSNPLPIIFWKKLGIPPCNDLWPCYNGLYDGEGVVFQSSEDINDIHSMGYFGRNVFEERGHDSCIRGIPVFRERQWRKMAKWAADSGYVITEQEDDRRDDVEDDRRDDVEDDRRDDAEDDRRDDAEDDRRDDAEDDRRDDAEDDRRDDAEDDRRDVAEDDRRDDAGSAEKEGKEEECSNNNRSHQEGNVDRKEFDLEKEDTAEEFNLISKDEVAITIASEEKGNVSDIGKSGNQLIHAEEIKEKNSSRGESKVEKLGEERSRNEGETDTMKGNNVRKEPRKKSDSEERCLGNRRDAVTKDSGQEGNNEEEKDVMEVVEEVSFKKNSEIKKDKGKEEDSNLNGVKSEITNKSDMGDVLVKDEVSIVSFPINTEIRNLNLETKHSREPALVIESQEKGKIHNSDDFVEIIEETSMAKVSEYVSKSNVESLKKRKPKRRFEDESYNNKEKRTKKDVLKCEDDVNLDGLSANCSCKPLDDVGKCSVGVLNSSGECEIVEINDRKTSRTVEWGGKRENSETDDDVIVVNVDDGDHCMDHASDKCIRLLSYCSPKDVVLPLGKRQNEAKGNDTGRNTHDKYKFMKEEENDMIKIDMHGKEMLVGKADVTKCDDVEELYQKGNGFNNCDDKDKTGSTAGSLKSEGEVSPCIVIADSDSEDETERGPQWESNPSELLPSLEWLKLFPEEAFFLAYGLGCVQVWDARKTEVEDEIVKIKEKKSVKQHDYPASVNSESKKNDSMNSALSPCNLENSDNTLPMVSACDKAKGGVFIPASSFLSDRVTAVCDEKGLNKKKNILSDEMEKNMLATDAVDRNERSSGGKPKDNRSWPLSVSEGKFSSDPSDMNGSITVIDLVDSPPSNRHLVDKEFSSIGNMDQAAECTGGKQTSEFIFDFSSKAMSLEELWNAFRLSRASQSSIPFETSYAVYHHFRSKGWVVKPGIRFGGDFLLYKDGPSFYHASYLVVIDSSLPHEGSAITWNTLAGLNRLAENVAKELMICRVEWPQSMMESQLWSPKCLDGLTVEEILVKRWVSMKERDADEEASGDDKNCDFIPLAI